MTDGDDRSESEAVTDTENGVASDTDDSVATATADPDSATTGGESSSIGRTGPFSDLAAATDDGRNTNGGRTRDDGSGPDSTPAPDFDELFEREDVAEIDSDRLWERLEADDPTDAGTTDDGREIREIRKGSYCHQCEHFSDPPAVECTLEGTDILELASLETFRVADCPVVLEDEKLEQRY